jgi:type II secretion system protein G
MPNYFYTDKFGQKQGPYTAQQVKELVEVWKDITPDTLMETDTGQKGKASQIRGLFSATPAAAPAPATAEPAPLFSNAEMAMHSERVSNFPQPQTANISNSGSKVLKVFDWIISPRGRYLAPFIAVAVVAPFFLFFALSAANLEGKWVRTGGDDDFAESIELLKDGSGVIDGREITWSMESQKAGLRSRHYFLNLKFNDNNGGDTLAKYTMSGSSLTLEFTDGKVSYKKLQDAVVAKQKAHQAMTDAANKMFATYNESYEEISRIMGSTLLRVGPVGAAMSLKKLRDYCEKYKTEVEAISLSDCSAAFQKAFTAWKKAALAEADFLDEFVDSIMKANGQLTEEKKKELDKKAEQLAQQTKDAVTKFKEMCRKLRLDVEADHLASTLLFENQAANEERRKRIEENNLQVQEARLRNELLREEHERMRIERERQQQQQQRETAERRQQETQQRREEAERQQQVQQQQKEEAERQRQERQVRRTVLSSLRVFASVIDTYKGDVGQYPTTEQGLAALYNRPADLPASANWQGAYRNRSASTTDPWGNPYRYASPGKNGRAFDIWSVGPDGKDGTADDVGHWMSLNDL